MYLLITFGIAFLSTAALYFFLDVPPWAAWLIDVNVVTFLSYWYDKLQAGAGGSRVPELVLLALAGVGGTAGALVAMYRLRHKTVKTSFQVRFWLIVALQVVLVLVYAVWRARVS